MVITCLMVPFSRCFFIAFLMRNFFFSNSMSGYFFRIYFMTDWYEAPDLSLQDWRKCTPGVRRRKPHYTHIIQQRQRVTKLVHTPTASMRMLSILCWVPAKLVTGSFLLPEMLAHAGIFLLTFLALDLSYLYPSFNLLPKRNETDLQWRHSAVWKRYFTVIVLTLIFITSSP